MSLLKFELDGLTFQNFQGSKLSQGPTKMVKTKYSLLESHLRKVEYLGNYFYLNISLCTVHKMYLKYKKVKMTK